jgi:hypothetical protein
VKRCMLVAYTGVFSVTLAAAVWYPAPDENRIGAECQTVADPEDEKCRDYQARIEACAHRLDARTRIARKLIDGRLSLLEAADRYRDLNETAADFDWYGFRHSYPGQSDDERTCRQVIKTAISLAEDDAKQLVAVTERLERELHSHLQHGSLCIPR